MQVSEGIERYVRHLIDVRRLSPATVRAYRSDLADMTAVVGDVPLGDVDLEALRSWLWHATKRGDARTTLARRTAAARGFFSWATEYDHVAVDPSLRLVGPKRGRTLPRVATAEALGRALDDLRSRAADGDPRELRDAAMLELLYGAGLRVSELCGVDVDDLDSSSATVRVLGKGSKERLVGGGSYAARALDEYLVRGRPAASAKGKGTPALFLNARGGRLSRQSAWTILKTAAEKADIGRDVSPHTLRHSFATHLLKGGAHVRVVQELLGHASLTTTQVYTLVTAETLREVYAAAHPRAL